MGIDVVYVGSYHNEVGLMVKQSREQGFKAQFVSEDATVTDELWKVSGPAAEGLLMTFAPDPMANPAAKRVVDAFKTENYNPEGYTLYAYAAFQVWAAAAKAAGSTDGAEGRRADPRKVVRYRGRQAAVRRQGRREQRRVCLVRLGQGRQVLAGQALTSFW